MKFITLVLVLLLGSTAQAADLDVLLQQIKTDIAANRLSTPAGNNALERIDTYRERAPFDYRVIPLMYQWGEAYLRLADEAMDNGDMNKANLYLQRVWRVASLTPGLEQAQARLDQLDSTTQQVARKSQQKDQAAEAERQRRMAAAAAQERAQLERERQRRLQRARREAEAERQRLIAERKQREEEERQRRAEAQKAAQQPDARTAQQQAPPASPQEKESARELWDQAEEDRPPLAKYDLDGGMISDRNRGIGDALESICRAILENDASVVIHTEDKSDYRWLTVRLTLCLRRLDDNFRLRHSFETLAEATPFLTLHPPREVSLVRKAAD